MAKYRLKMATQLGEKVATGAGFTAFPVLPMQVAADNRIKVQAKPPDMDGVSGAMIMAGNDITIIYSTAYNNRGFENFSLSHELGHFFLPGHPEEIIAAGGKHVSRANFTENTSIELEADHFASGLLMPSQLTRKFLASHQIGLDGIISLAGAAECSLTAAAIRAAECCSYPVAVIMSRGTQVLYAFMSDSFKGLGRLDYLKKGTPLPRGETRRFNAEPDRVAAADKSCAVATLEDWFGGSRGIKLDEEVLGLGRYGCTLTVLSSESLPDDPEFDDEADADLEKSWKPRFAYGR